MSRMPDEDVLKVTETMRGWIDDGFLFVFAMPFLTTDRGVNTLEAPARATLKRVEKVIEYREAGKERSYNETMRQFRSAVGRGQAAPYQYMLWSMAGCEFESLLSQKNNSRILLKMVAKDEILKRYIANYSLEERQVEWRLPKKEITRHELAVAQFYKTGERSEFLGKREKTQKLSLFQKFRKTSKCNG